MLLPYIIIGYYNLMPHIKKYLKAIVDIFFEESRIKIRISKKILSRKKQTIQKDRTQSF